MIGEQNIVEHVKLGDRIAELRKKRSLTQGALAKELDISQSTLAMWETEQRSPDATKLKKLASYFNVSIDYLLGRSESDSYGSSRDIRDLREFLGRTEIMFDGVPMTDEDKARIQGYMEGMFWEAKKLNKRKKDTEK